MLVKIFRGEKRRMCAWPKCKNITPSKGFQGTRKRFRKYCHKHRQGKTHSKLNIKILPDKCQVCDWNKGTCDRHRLVPKKGYINSNVVILCPNCHRLIHEGKIFLKNIKKS